MECYYLGALILRPWNGVVGGFLGAMGLFIISAVFGNDFWTNEVIDGTGIRFNTFIWGGMLILGIQQTLEYILNITKHAKKFKKPGDLTGEPFNKFDF